MAREVETRSPEETQALGREWGARLRPGDVVLLEGELGAGKTTFVKGIAEACGVQGLVRSPTFALMHRYRGDPDVVHIDLYRQGASGGVGDLDLEADAAEVVTVVEWPRDRADRWPHALRVKLQHVDEETRRITLP